MEALNGAHRFRCLRLFQSNALYLHANNLAAFFSMCLLAFPLKTAVTLQRNPAMAPLALDTCLLNRCNPFVVF